MSVTITIVDNCEYCDENSLVRTEIEPCLCLHDGKPEADCHYCQGSGKWTEKIYPFEMNLANGNFATLWKALGLNKLNDDMWGGSLDGRIILRALATLDRSRVLRAPSKLIEDGQPAIYVGGIDHEQAERYISTLTQIANEATRRESHVCWN